MKITLFRAFPGKLPYESNHVTVEFDEADINDLALSSQEVEGMVASGQKFLDRWAAERAAELGAEASARLQQSRPAPSAPPQPQASAPRPSAPAQRPAPAPSPFQGGGGGGMNEWGALMRRIEAATGKERKDFEMHFFRGCAWFKAKDTKQIVGISANHTYESLLNWKPKWAAGVLEKCVKAVKALEFGDEVTLHYNIWNREKKSEEWREIRYRGRAVGVPAEGAAAAEQFSAPVAGSDPYMPGLTVDDPFSNPSSDTPEGMPF